MENVAAAVQLSDLLRRLRHPAIGAAFAAHVALAVGLSFVPLFASFGFERAFATGVLSGLTAPLIGWALARRLGPDDEEAAELGWGAQLALGLVVHGGTLAPTVVAGWIVESVGTRCDPGAGLLFVALIPGAGGVYGLACGQWLRSVFGRRGAALVPVLAAAHLGAALARLYAFPQIYAFDPLLGFWPGSLYDEALSPSAALLAHRAFTVALGLSLTALGATIRPPRASVARRGAALLAGAVAIAAATTLFGARQEHGWGTGYGRIDAELSYVVPTEHFVLHLPAGTSVDQADEIAREHEFWFERLRPFFEKAPVKPVQSYLYANAQQKARLMGASNTKIARPWAREMHMHGLAMPHGSLAHELAHVLAAEWAPGPLHVPALFGVWPQMGLVEGLAVAADWPRDHATIHQKTKALRQLDLLPDLRTTLSWTGFWRQASSRAYTAAGSFVRWVRDERGALALAELYRTGSVPRALGQSVDEAVTAWEAFLEGVEVSDRTVAWAQARYRRPSIFNRACPHETAILGAEAQRHLSTQRFDQAEEVVERLYELYPDPGWPLAVARSAAREDRPELARRWLDRLPPADELDVQRRREAHEVRAALDWRRGDWAAARAELEAARALAVSYDVERLETARLEATTRTATTASLILGYLDGAYGGEEGLARLMTADALGTDGLIDYLIARRLHAAGAADLAEAHTRRAMASGLPSVLHSEARAMLARQLAATGRLEAAQAELEALLEADLRPALRAEAEEWRDRVRFIQRWSNPPRDARTREES